MRFELQFFGEEEEEGRGRVGGKKEEENWKQSEGREETFHPYISRWKFRENSVRRHKFEHFSKKLLTTEPFSPLRQFAMV